MSEEELTSAILFSQATLIPLNFSGHGVKNFVLHTARSWQGWTVMKSLQGKSSSASVMMAIDILVN